MPLLREADRRDYVMGNVRVVRGDLSRVADGDTWAPGLMTIERVHFEPASDTHTSVGYRVSISGTRVLFSVSSGTISGTITVYGY